MDVNGLRFWMLSQLNDWLPPWRASSGYAVGQGVVDPNGYTQIVQTAGKSDARQPQWNAVVGQTTMDGTLTWVNSGPGSWHPTTSYAVGQCILDPNLNVQCVSKAGVTGAISPGSWPQSPGHTISDGTLTWSYARPSQAGLSFCNKDARLQLRSMWTGSVPVETFTDATRMVNAVPIAQDQFGTYARWDPSSGHVVAGGGGPSDAAAPDEIPIYAPSQASVSDVALGYDGILYIAVAGSLVMVDRRNRWPDFTLNVRDFNFWRLLPLPKGGVLALDRNQAQLGIVSGQPLQTGPVDTPDPSILRACDPNPNPPRIVSRIALPASEWFVALAPMDPTQNPLQFVLLSWASNNSSNQLSYVRIGTVNNNQIAWQANAASTGAPLQLTGVRMPYSVAAVNSQTLAVLATNLNEALIYDLANAGDTLLPAGETYILAANNVGPFTHSFNLPPSYANAPGATPLILPLLPLSLNSFAATGATDPASPAIVDSGTSQTVWHRMFLEAIIPPRCGALLWLAAADRPADLMNPALTTWYPHIVGAADTSSLPLAILPEVPTAVWQSIPTEVPFAPTLLKEDPVSGRQGLFMVLVQRANKAVRNLSGRYLGVRIQLNGDGRDTPEIAGLRIYASRFSYVQHYLPAIYHEAKSGAEADRSGESTRRDFFERFVDLFESQFTRIENQIAHSYLLTRPESTPDDSLGWLGGWIGIEPNNYPPQRRRARMLATPALYQERGTTAGVTRALDVATNGMCSRGAIIVIEDFRLRHIFATILGADLSVKNNPLLPGYSPASNSIVGSTLFLGDPAVQEELQALYATDLDIAGSSESVQAFYDRLAARITVFIHNQVENVNLNLVQRIVEAEKPAHVQAFVRVASQPFMIGLASLAGVNTYLAPEPPRNTVTVNVSEIGRYDIVTHMPSLDPRLGDLSYQAYGKPIARAKAPTAVRPGDTIVLDGSASTPPSGSNITSYRWTLLQPPS